MIPLINVVFLMLAFFMIAGQIQKSDNVRLNTPESLSDMDRERSLVTISINANEELFVNGVSTDENQLIERIKSIGTAGSIEESHTILVRADARLPASKTREVLKLLRQAGLQRVSLATLQTRTSYD